MHSNDSTLPFVSHRLVAILGVAVSGPLSPTGGLALSPFKGAAVVLIEMLTVGHGMAQLLMSPADASNRSWSTAKQHIRSHLQARHPHLVWALPNSKNPL